MLTLAVMVARYISLHSCPSSCFAFTGAYARLAIPVTEKPLADDMRVFWTAVLMLWFASTMLGTDAVDSLRHNGTFGKKLNSCLQVAEMILDSRTLEFYKWDGDVKEKLAAVKDKINELADSWSREQKDHCLEETQTSFKVCQFSQVFRHSLS